MGDGLDLGVGMCEAHRGALARSMEGRTNSMNYVERSPRGAPSPLHILHLKKPAIGIFANLPNIFSLSKRPIGRIQESRMLTLQLSEIQNSKGKSAVALGAETLIPRSSQPVAEACRLKVPQYHETVLGEGLRIIRTSRRICRSVHAVHAPGLQSRARAQASSRSQGQAARATGRSVHSQRDQDRVERFAPPWREEFMLALGRMRDIRDDFNLNPGNQPADTAAKRGET